jgi:pyruvate ferredoxin oxidoreductase gamma subunit
LTVYRIRFHGRGGQGIKTAGRVLGAALFAEGFEVQDAPVYGAERRGAPMSAHVRADRAPIRERGLVANPDLVVVADDSLAPLPAAGVLLGLSPNTVVLIHSSADSATWRSRLALGGPVFTLPPAETPGDELQKAPIGIAAAGAAARLLGVIGRHSLARAIGEELAPLGTEVAEASSERALAAYDALAAHAGAVREGPAVAAAGYAVPEWIELANEPLLVAAPHIHAAATGVQSATGAWRSLRPVIDLEHCNRCTWVCSTLCPDSAISVDAQGAPRIDYDHCKGCMICVAVCPPHAIRAEPERAAAAEASP